MAGYGTGKKLKDSKVCNAAGLDLRKIVRRHGKEQGAALRSMVREGGQRRFSAPRLRRKRSPMRILRDARARDCFAAATLL